MATKKLDDKGYYLNDEGVFFRANLNDKTHLVKIFGGTPGFNKELYDNNRENIKTVGALTRQGKKFEISREDFENYRIEKQLGGFEPQYFVGKNRWKITIK